jgi:calcium permeable stress-gated cation channel
MIHAEMRHFVIKRQQHLVDPAHSSTAQANTIMITGIPPKYITQKALTELFAPLPGGVRKVWLNRDLKQLPDIYDARLKACKLLESAETQLIATAVKMKAKKSQTKDKVSIHLNSFFGSSDRRLLISRRKSHEPPLQLRENLSPRLRRLKLMLIWRGVVRMAPHY